ncbi:Hsp20/alpha crystallin family protein [Arcobacter vandammei]|uniref:Hsp20/alpha crystallin family protein n=1 Tax=Arcobacter vandammei TaxID=2782243 RepID=UPI0018E064C9|nr:Hsp20/alpha crystallin family protein [Arcobacter vandammei]
MLLTKFDPFKQLKDLEKSFYKQPSNEGVSAFVPVVNTREGDFAYHVDVDLPGVKKEDIKVDINKGILTISGERKVKEEIKEEDYYKVETYFGKFSRSFTLPDNADIENIEAKNDNGVLEVVIPKLKDDNSRKSIEIK